MMSITGLRDAALRSLAHQALQSKQQLSAKDVDGLVETAAQGGISDAERSDLERILAHDGAFETPEARLKLRAFLEKNTVVEGGFKSVWHQAPAFEDAEIRSLVAGWGAVWSLNISARDIEKVLVAAGDDGRLDQTEKQDLVRLLVRYKPRLTREALGLLENAVALNWNQANGSGPYVVPGLEPYRLDAALAESASATASGAVPDAARSSDGLVKDVEERFAGVMGSGRLDNAEAAWLVRVVAHPSFTKDVARAISKGLVDALMANSTTHYPDLHRLQDPNDRWPVGTAKVVRSLFEIPWQQTELDPTPEIDHLLPENYVVPERTYVFENLMREFQGNVVPISETALREALFDNGGVSRSEAQGLVVLLKRHRGKLTTGAEKLAIEALRTVGGPDAPTLDWRAPAPEGAVPLHRFALEIAKRPPGPGERLGQPLDGHLRLVLDDGAPLGPPGGVLTFTNARNGKATSFTISDDGLSLVPETPSPGLADPGTGLVVDDTVLVGNRNGDGTVTPYRPQALMTLRGWEGDAFSVSLSVDGSTDDVGRLQAMMVHTTPNSPSRIGDKGGAVRDPAVGQFAAESHGGLGQRLFTGPLFGAEGPRPTDVRVFDERHTRHAAALAAMAAVKPERIKDLISASGDSYTVRVNQVARALDPQAGRNLVPTEEKVDADLYLRPSGHTRFGAGPVDENGKMTLWFPLIEKALAQSISNRPGRFAGGQAEYGSLHGVLLNGNDRGVRAVAEPLFGEAFSSLGFDLKGDKAALANALQQAHEQKRAMVLERENPKGPASWNFGTMLNPPLFYSVVDVETTGAEPTVTVYAPYQDARLPGEDLGNGRVRMTVGQLMDTFKSVEASRA